MREEKEHGMRLRFHPGLVAYCVALCFNTGYGTCSEYEVVILAGDGVSPRSTILKVAPDFQTISQLPIEGEGILGPFRPFDIAVTPDRSIYGVEIVSGDFTYSLGRLGDASTAWTVTVYPDFAGSTWDLEATPAGNLVQAGDDFGITAIDVTSGELRDVPVFVSGPEGDRRGFHVAVSPKGVIASDGTRHVVETGQYYDTIFRLPPGQSDPIRTELDVLISDFVFDGEESLIAIGCGGLCHIDLETAKSTVLSEEPLLRYAREIALDPQGRIVALTIAEGLPDHLVRLDLTDGSTEVLNLQTTTAADMDILVLPPPPAELQAGDADQDLDFDQFDLIQVLQAGKYLSGLEATWGEGDWSGAPGGAPGSPPAGDGVFDQLDLIKASLAGLYGTGPYAAFQPGGRDDDAQTSLVYDATTGEVRVDVPAGVELTSINIDSASGIFTGDAAQNLGGSFDHDGDANIFKATFGGSFSSLSFGNVAPAGLSEEFVASDLTVIGSLQGGGPLGEVDLIYVPEPSAMLMAALGLVLMAVAPRPGRDSRRNGARMAI
jgi:hypothetical protein